MRVMSRGRTALAVALVLLVAAFGIGVTSGARADASKPKAAVAPAHPDGPGIACSSPQDAVRGLLHWLQPETFEPGKAALCQDRGRLKAPDEEGPRLARQLKEILDARGLRIAWEAIPNDPDHVDREGLPVYDLVPTQIQGIRLVKRGERWLFSADTLALVPALHADTFPADVTRLIDALPDWARASLFRVQVWQWLGLAFLVLLALVIRRLVVRGAVRWLSRGASRLQRLDWVEDAARRASGPIGGLVLAGVVSFGLPLLQLPITLSSKLRLGAFLLAAFGVIILAFRAIDLFSERLQRRAAATDSRLDDQLVPIIKKSLKVVVGVLGLLSILQNLDVDVDSLIATLGIGGLAFALAAKDTLSNFFGSTMIFIDKPFQIGDFVTIGGNVSGTVEEVGFRTSRLRVSDGSLITIPNARMTDTHVQNLGARPNRRYEFTVGLTYATTPEQMHAFCEGVAALIEAHPGTLKGGKHLVRFVGFGASSLDVMVRCWFDTRDFNAEQSCKHLLNLEVLRLVEALGLSFAFPSQSLYVESMPREAAPLRETRDPLAIARAFGPGGDQSRYDAWRLSGMVLPEPPAAPPAPAEPEAKPVS